MFYTTLELEIQKKWRKVVAEGAKSGGDVEVELSYHVDAESLVSYDVVLVGSPTYHHDVPIDFKNLFEEVAVKGMSLKGKIGAAFGSYGWSGEAPKLIAEIMEYKFEMRMAKAPLLAKYVPDQNIIDACRALGAKVSESLMNRA